MNADGAEAQHADDLVLEADRDGAPQRASWRWYWNRMRVMEPLELPYRVGNAVERLRAGTAARLGVMQVPPPRPALAAPARWLADDPAVPEAECGRVIEEADRVAQGRLRRLDGGTAELGLPPDWQNLRLAPDPGTGVADPLRESIELHRHGHLVRLAQAWRLRANARHLRALCEQLDAWLLQCPFPQGVAWASALDAGLRLLNWSMVWQLLRIGQPGGAALPPDLQLRWIAAVHVHAGFVHRHRSRHSSANNHLLGELVGLVAAGATWPLWPEVVRWSAAAAREVVVEAIKQTHDDGSGREQASWYQVFDFELLAAFVCIQRAQGVADESRLMRRLGAMARFVAALRDAGGHLSHHGDADHASALPLFVGERCGYERLLALAVGIGAAPDLQPLLMTEAPECAWLFGAPVRPQRSAASVRQVRAGLPRAFREGGLYLLGDAFGGAGEVLMTVDAGTLGYLGIAAHGHADALSLRLSVDGRPVLVDRGTYTYNGAPGWRRYLRGTSAHNTVTVGGVEQSDYGGPFLWLRKARCELVSFDSTDLHGHVEAWHDGYQALVSPVLHRRRVRWNGTARRFEVNDTLEGQGEHPVLVAWHFAPDCEVLLRGDSAFVTVPGGTTLRLRMPEAPAGGRWTMRRGGTGPHGWHSPRFGVRVPAPTLLWRHRVQAPCRIDTWIEIETHRGVL